ncbi:MAG: hypothetical protein KJ737_26575 [Proteobacteria bacterium]|nr:hypothetical protein [Pseudomonadota bacterium]
MTIKRFLKAVAVMVAITAFNNTPGMASESEVLIIANKDMTINSLSKAEIKNIFLGMTTFWPDNTKITFATLVKLEVHKRFVVKYTNKSTDQFRAYWRNQLFIGKGRIPKIFKTEQEIVNFVAKTDGAIGYVSPSAAIDTVKVITVSDN